MKYHKIHAPYKRYTEGPSKGRFIPGEFSQPWFEALYRYPWHWYEKIDGTNIRVYWEPSRRRIEVRGRTDNAVLCPALVKHIEGLFEPEQLLDAGFDKSLIFYGEGIGSHIQKGSDHYSLYQVADDKGRVRNVGFILFDVYRNGFFPKMTEKTTVEETALSLGIEYAPYCGEYTLEQAEEIYMGPDGFFSGVRTGKPEGLIGVPKFDLHAGNTRIITKLKLRDYK